MKTINPGIGDLDWSDEPHALRGWPWHSQCSPGPEQQGHGWTRGAPPVSVARPRYERAAEPQRRGPDERRASIAPELAEHWRAEHDAGVTIADIARAHKAPESTVRGRIQGDDPARNPLARRMASEWAQLLACGWSSTRIGMAYSVAPRLVRRAAAEVAHE